jgi:hypothetical protein
MLPALPVQKRQLTNYPAFAGTFLNWQGQGKPLILGHHVS